jgi:hypothetical protein
MRRIGNRSASQRHRRFAFPLTRLTLELQDSDVTA